MAAYSIGVKQRDFQTTELLNVGIRSRHAPSAKKYLAKQKPSLHLWSSAAPLEISSQYDGKSGQQLNSINTRVDPVNHAT
jgi:hypothetical protein